jgi:ketosteroid isomerase-like protein
MSIHENKALVRRYFEEAPYNTDICDQIFAAQIPWHALYRTTHPDFISNPQAEKAAFSRHKTLWGGWSESIDEMIAEGDRVIVRWTFNGIHQGEYLGITPTHKPVSFTGIYIFRIQDGRIAEVWNLWDQVGEWQQLGILPETSELLDQAKEKGEK